MQPFACDWKADNTSRINDPSAYLAESVVIPLQRWDVVWKADITVFFEQWPMEFVECQPVLL